MFRGVVMTFQRVICGPAGAVGHTSPILALLCWAVLALPPAKLFYLLQTYTMQSAFFSSQSRQDRVKVAGKLAVTYPQ